VYDIESALTVPKVPMATLAVTNHFINVFVFIYFCVLGCFSINQIKPAGSTWRSTTFHRIAMPLAKVCWLGRERSRSEQSVIKSCSKLVFWLTN
jgi:TRAP-type C4-dicarboxylate transport system permease small subunit